MHDMMETIESGRPYRETKPFENGKIGINGISLLYVRDDFDRRGIVNLQSTGRQWEMQGSLLLSAALPSGQTVIW